MNGLVSNFDVPLCLGLVIGLLTLILATSVARRRHKAGLPWLVMACRVMAVGNLLVVFAATAFPRSLNLQDDGDLVLVPGRGGLGDLDQIFADPTSLAAALFYANIALYASLAFFAALGLPQRRGIVLSTCLGVSVLVEMVQYLALGRVAATDDVIVNMLGAIIGLGLAMAIRPERWHRTEQGDASVDRGEAGTRTTSHSD